MRETEGGERVLQLILGRAGSGKTTTVMEELAARAAAGEEGLLLIVPEQFSFESERALLRRLGARGAARVRVLSFTRMADAVARECGGFSGRLMDDVTRTLLMSRALDTVRDRLVLYRRAAARADYVHAALDVAAECKQYAVPPRELANAAATLPEGTLRQKLRELSEILSAYEALAADSYVDPADALTRLREQLPQSGFARGAAVYVDGFKGFTEQELRVMELLLRRASSVTVTLCTDTLDTHDEFALFAPVSRTAARFVRMARDGGVDVAAPRYLRENHRAANPALRTLESGCFVAGEEPYAEPTDAVALAPCADRYAECRTVAHELRRMLRTEGLRCRDIAVTARNLAEYDGILDTALREAGIPFYIDRREDVRTEPLMALAASALRCVAGGFRGEDALQLMKTGLLGFSPASIARMENYIYQWKLNGVRLRQTWTANPEGLTVRTDESTARTLAYLNRLRHRLMTPLEALAHTFEGKIDGLTFARAVYDYLEKARVARLVRLQVRRLHAADEPLAAERMERMWELLMTLLDHFAVALRTTVMTAAEWEELFSLAASSVDVGSLPQGLDAVQIGSAERMRFSAPRVVWILGANEGVFPAYPAPGGLFSDRERRTLREAGVTLSEPSEGQAVEERLVAYLALAAPSERLIVSYLTGAGEDGTLTPSTLVESIHTLIPGAATVTAAAPEYASEAFDRLSVRWEASDGETAALRRYFAELPEYAAQLHAMARAAAGEAAAFANPAAARAFFGDRLTLSPSQVDKFFQCPFAYFCRYGLRVESRRPAELGGLESGDLAHYVMQTVLPGYTKRGFDTITRESVETDVAAAVEQYLAEYMGGVTDKSARFLAQAARLRRTVTELMWQVVQEMRQSRFVPVDYELPVGGEGGVPATVLTLPDGTSVRVIGRVDRVDVYRDGDVAYVRVVDYKTGPKEFRLSEVAAGLNLQMLLYIFSLWDNGAARYGGKVVPAGVLYLPARMPIIKAAPEKSDVEQKREHIRAMRMNGLLLDDPAVLTAMESDGAGLFIPAKLTQSGAPDAYSSVASLAQLGRLRRRAERLLGEMVESLRAGRVAATPARSSQMDACAYCDYRAVCGHEADDPVREIASARPGEVWQALAQEEGEHPDA